MPVQRNVHDKVPIAGAGVNGIPQSNSFARLEFRNPRPTRHESIIMEPTQGASVAGWLVGNARA